MSHEIDRRRLRAGIVGGGRGAFIGAIHRIAAELDGEASIVAGALSADPATARESAAAWRLERSYDSYESMARAEATRDGGIDFVIIVTPNHLHVPIARAFVEAGIHVVCDKPLGVSLAEASELEALVAKRGTLFALTHNYTGYSAVREARALVRAGRLGEIRKVHVEYLQDWLMQPLESTGNKQASWRVDPTKAGPAGCVGDIGTHAENLLEYVTGLRITSLCADLSTFVPARKLDDDANMLLRLQNGVKGTLLCSQVACGEENDLQLRVYGTLAGIEWNQQEPNTLLFKPAGKPALILRAGKSFDSADAKAATRLPAGHPEGYLEAFAVLYRNFIADVRRIARGEKPAEDYPLIGDGIRGMRFVEKAVESSAKGACWVEL